MSADTNTKKEPHKVQYEAYEHIDALAASTEEAQDHASEARDAVAELTDRLESALRREDDLQEELNEEIASRDSYEEDAKRDGESAGRAKALEILQDVERELITLAEARDRIQRLEG